jgi:predicted ATPase
VDTLLTSCPRLKVLATSREPLGVAGEVDWQVSTVSLPDAVQESTVEGLVRT